MLKLKSYAVFLFIVVLATLAHLHFTIFFFRSLNKNVTELPNTRCNEPENHKYCEKYIYKVFPYILDKDNNIIFLYPEDENNKEKIENKNEKEENIIEKIKTEEYKGKLKFNIDGDYIKAYIYYILLNLRFRTIDILLFSIIVFFALSFFEYTKYLLGDNDENIQENYEEDEDYG